MLSEAVKVRQGRESQKRLSNPDISVRSAFYEYARYFRDDFLPKAKILHSSLGYADRYAGATMRSFVNA